ncbi:MAG: divalent cation transporter [Rhodobacterales bacterium CG15_BIG_FIL_POST_REV_8_21_14_020_59_13]|nr:MAG: divalent cation transporter [Rhodobacterales bacterium CG15_BIG_FIL_POST_REV_8_21_14_020_59_13]
MSGLPALDVILLALLAGSTIPIGATLALEDRIHPDWMTTEFRHGVMAFGGGVLIAAVALVLVPEGSDRMPPFAALASFAAGGVAFFLLDRALEKSGKPVGQLLAMLVDFVPEAIALGAILATGSGTGLLLALLIALQNLPESFNAYRELASRKKHISVSTFGLFLVLPALGPVAAILGAFVFAASDLVLGGLMLFAAGGILYLTFQDVAPQVQLKASWMPSLGAVAGFLLGLSGDLLIT